MWTVRCCNKNNWKQKKKKNRENKLKIVLKEKTEGLFSSNHCPSRPLGYLAETRLNKWTPHTQIHSFAFEGKCGCRAHGFTLFIYYQQAVSPHQLIPFTFGACFPIYCGIVIEFKHNVLSNRLRTLRRRNSPTQINRTFVYIKLSMCVQRRSTSRE